METGGSVKKHGCVRYREREGDGERERNRDIEASEMARSICVSPKGLPGKVRRNKRTGHIEGYTSEPGVQSGPWSSQAAA